MRIDAHQHYWKPERGDYGFLTPEAGALNRDYGPGDVAPAMAAAGFAKAIAVQAAPTAAETRYLLRVASREPAVAGVVGWLDFEAGAADFDRELATWEGEPMLVGVRPMLQDLPADYALQPGVMRNIGAFAESGLALDWLVRPRHLPAVVRVMAAFPRLKGIVDHLGKPDPRDEAGMAEWREGLGRLAELPNAACKLSGLFTEAGPERPGAETLRSIVARVCESFGEDRLLYGSDWPVSLLAGEYAEVAAWTDALLPASWGEPQRDKLYGGNAVRWYGLAEEGSEES